MGLARGGRRGASFEAFSQNRWNLSKHSRSWRVSRQPGRPLENSVHGGDTTPTSPDVVPLQQAGYKAAVATLNQEYAKLVNERPATTLRDLLAIAGENAVNIADVEPASELFKRFDTAAMSIGALAKPTRRWRKR